jgi:hypothetical protein
MTTNLTSRAQRLIEEFDETEDVRHGIAAVLTHLANAHDSYSDGDEFWHGVTTNTLDDLAAELTAPTLLDRALAGDWKAARQFLHEAGFTDHNGQLLPQFQAAAELEAQ